MRSHPRSVAALPVFALMLAAVCSLLAAPVDIAPDAVLQHIKFLSSDELQGRGNGSPELEAAGDYVARQFKAAGLQPGGTSNEWFQPFQLNAGLTVGSGNKLSVIVKGRTVNFALGTS